MRRSDGGSVMLEFVLCFPIVLVLMFACIQFAHLWSAKMIVHYAAYCAARSALVCKSDEYNDVGLRAAQQVCDWMGNGVLQQKQPPTVTDDPHWNVTATVTEDFSLFAPIVGPIIAWGMNPWDQTSPWAVPLQSSANTDAQGFPTITLTERVTLPKPYVTVVPAGF